MTPNGSSARVRFGPYEADLRTDELWKYGTRIKLVGQPFAILEVLLERPGDLVTREELRSRLWPGDTFVDFDHGLNAAVNKLRDALNDSADNPKYIETLPRRGYRFIGRVEPAVPVATDAGSPPSPVPAPVPAKPPASVQAPVEAHEAPPQGPRSRRGLKILSVLVAVLGAGLVTGAIHHLFSGSSAQQEEQQAKLQAEARGKIGKNQGPQFSPDSRKVAFGSTRTGTSEIWISDRDGSNARQFTGLENCGTPRWSADGKYIAFDRSESGDQRQIFVVPVDGGAPRQLTFDHSDNSVPSWSRDSRWVYFASNRTGAYQVWKLPLEGGKAVQVTHNGGFAAFEAPDGSVYFAKSRFPNPELWRVPAGGGNEALLIPRIVPGTWASWGITNKGLYYIEEHPGLSPRVSLFEFAGGKISDVTALDRFSFFFSVSPDDKWFGYEESEIQDGKIVVIPNPLAR